MKHDKILMYCARREGFLCFMDAGKKRLKVYGI